MINITEFFSCIFYILLMVLTVVLIIFTVNAIKTLNKVDKLVDDITLKSTKLNGVFNIIDGATDAVVGFSDSIVGFFTNGLNKLFNRKRENENE